MMETVYRTRARVGEDGTVTLSNLPFPAGSRVEVTLLRAEQEHGAQADSPPQPTEPVTEHERDVLE